ncbi:hypothetical protein GALMADRAFT_933755 [Galerina marginata CBS 339.88]|uniref:Uncharacterized protein n=1 Tax=Galerina marginata (strain CBS 339.88) TaxID=685588 RepID=A0A067SDU8_GALM3|nr:hypothetical protein GALMADRAFT_933755 [Galerina marginata CBS 339.88]
MVMPPLRGRGRMTRQMRRWWSMFVCRDGRDGCVDCDRVLPLTSARHPVPVRVRVTRSRHLHARRWILACMLDFVLPYPHPHPHPPRSPSPITRTRTAHPYPRLRPATTPLSSSSSKHRLSGCAEGWAFLLFLASCLEAEGSGRLGGVRARA